MANLAKKSGFFALIQPHKGIQQDFAISTENATDSWLRPPSEQQPGLSKSASHYIFWLFNNGPRKWLPTLSQPFAAFYSSS
ncbi:hypothetical protein [Pseudomonas syringae]|uniref:hypothetical protein n=1 Tax=Pseudomonas syringae TaxID=317 RepID=UPI00200A0230|nr:hypothetical protein [Pseudomonas syringae]MCK9739458.1 hypothetical protein [Pseudomonas syringae pv. syringae]